MNKNKKYIIKKIDAAIRQLDTAIDLWFNEADEVAIHTLVCSAHQIIHDINCHKKGPNLLFDNKYIKEEHRRQAIKYLKGHYNFFKHADQDPNPEGTVEFHPSLSEFFIMTACIGLEGMKFKPNSLRSAFVRYQMVHNTIIFTEEVQSFIKSCPIDLIIQIRNLNRLQFFNCNTRDITLFGAIQGVDNLFP